MFDLKEFNGTLVTEPYSINTFDELKRQILKEIVFYATGLGWSQCPNVVEEQCILFPYVEKERETSDEYIRELEFLVSEEIRYFRNCVTGTYNKPIDGFCWNLCNTESKDFFALVLHRL